jgi:peptide chain release factor 1
VSGKAVRETFAHESGGHRFQRIPPNEKRGRVHTSTITVAVLPELKESDLRIEERDIEWQTCRGSGCGGQNRNVTNSAVQMTHIPTGIRVRVENERSQLQNRETAMRILRSRVLEAREGIISVARADSRRTQVGSGQRADKIRTIRAQDGQVTDHRSGCQIRYKDYIRGDWKGLLR